jgi:hypothetical protein
MTPTVAFDRVSESCDEVSRYLISPNEGERAEFLDALRHMRLHCPGRGTFYQFYSLGETNRLILRFLGYNAV